MGGVIRSPCWTTQRIRAGRSSRRLRRPGAQAGLRALARIRNGPFRHFEMPPDRAQKLRTVEKATMPDVFRRREPKRIRDRKGGMTVVAINPPLWNHEIVGNGVAALTKYTADDFLRKRPGEKAVVDRRIGIIIGGCSRI